MAAIKMEHLILFVLYPQLTKLGKIIRSDSCHLATHLHNNLESVFIF